LPDDVIEYALRREVMEELGMRVVVDRLLRMVAIRFGAEEPGPYRLDFFFRCAPDIGFPALREGVDSGRIKPSSPEITRMRLVPLTDLGDYDIFSTDERFLKQDLPRLEPALAIRPGDKLLNDAGEPGTSS
jgi:8-oxo-dGTP pyrophosphatase MutT (NUDIX family)